MPLAGGTMAGSIDANADNTYSIGDPTHSFGVVYSHAFSVANLGVIYTDGTNLILQSNSGQIITNNTLHGYADNSVDLGTNGQNFAQVWSYQYNVAGAGNIYNNSGNLEINPFGGTLLVNGNLDSVSGTNLGANTPWNNLNVNTINGGTPAIQGQSVSFNTVSAGDFYGNIYHVGTNGSYIEDHSGQLYFSSNIGRSEFAGYAFFDGGITDNVAFTYAPSIDTNSRFLLSPSGVESVAWASGLLNAPTGGTTSVDWKKRLLIYSSGQVLVDWNGSENSSSILSFDRSTGYTYLTGSLINDNSAGGKDLGKQPTPWNNLWAQFVNSDYYYDSSGSHGLAQWNSGITAWQVNSILSFNNSGFLYIADHNGFGGKSIDPDTRQLIASDGSSIVFDYSGTPNAGAPLSYNSSTGLLYLGFGTTTYVDSGGNLNMGGASIDMGGAGNINMDGGNIVVQGSTSMKIGTATTQKIAFYNSTPIVQPTGNIITALGNLGLVASGTISTANLPVGVPIIVGSDRATGQTAAKALATYTVGASDTSFHISAYVLISASTAFSFQVICTYTDEGNTSRTLTLNFSQISGTLVQTLTNVLGAGSYEGVPLHIRAKASTTIVIASTGTFTTVTYNLEERIMQL